MKGVLLLIEFDDNRISTEEITRRIKNFRGIETVRVT